MRSRAGSPAGRVDRESVFARDRDNVDVVDSECCSSPDSSIRNLTDDLSSFFEKISLILPRPYGGVTRWIPGRHGRETDLDRDMVGNDQIPIRAPPLND